MMNVFSIFVAQFFLTLAVLGWISSVYIYPRLARLPLREALTVLCFVHAFRSLGLIYLVPGVPNGPIPLDLAVPAGYGDFATAILAFIALVFLRNRIDGAIVVVWVVNIVGALDLGSAYFLGLVLHGWNYRPGVLWYNPTVIAPMLAVAHALAFRLLLKRRTETVGLPEQAGLLS